jgi:mono/diheme cytochrome c family protein
MNRIVAWSVAAGALIGFGTIAAAQDRASIEAGEQLYDEHCASCHGEKLRSPGAAFDLRTLRADDRERFDKSVKGGKGQMPAWGGVLQDSELDQLWAYIRSRAT